MTDIHCHILPCVDDGSSSWEETLDMARCAAADGIRTMYCTPHLNAETDSLRRLEEHEDLLAKVQRHLADEGIAVHLVSGVEWMLSPDLLETVRKKGRLGASRAFLFELSPFMPPAVAESFIIEAVRADLRPVLAHPERHPWMNEKNCTSLNPLAASGCMFQLTAGSLVGDFGKHVRRTGERIARLFPDAVLLASDAHNMRERQPFLKKGYDALEALDSGLAERAKRNLKKLLRSE